jgi:mono/diheme cytochrome c family protein
MKLIAKQFIAIGVITSAVGVTAALAASAADNYDNHCAKCHGLDGKGQTKMGKKLNVRDMTSEAYKKEMDEAKALTSLKEGIKKDGKEIKKSFASELSDAELKALIAYVRGLK